MMFRSSSSSSKPFFNNFIITATTNKPSLYSVTTFSTYSSVPLGPPDPILGLTEAFNKDPDPRKITLGVGAYRDGDNKPWVLPSVRAAEAKILAAKLSKEYLGIAGDANFVGKSLQFAYGANSKPLTENRIAALQTLSGTGACRVAAEFLNRFKLSTNNVIYQPNPTWGNHVPIFKDAGMKVDQYKFYDPKTRGLDFTGMLESMDKAPDGSAFLLHACAHNPTGVDPSLSQWKEISKLMLKKKHITFFDCAYQGFASGDADKDAAAIRLFVQDGHFPMLAQSYAKNFGLYNDRIGAFSVVCQDTQEKERVESQLKILVRPNYSNPPAHGARIVDTILSDPVLKPQWYAECKSMADRIISMRTLLRNTLENDLKSRHSWKHVTDQIGMFAFTGLDKDQVIKMKEKHHIYMTADGRISVAGVTAKNVRYIAEAIHDVTK
jgi:aspartate aminotransferase